MKRLVAFAVITASAVLPLSAIEGHDHGGHHDEPEDHHDEHADDHADDHDEHAAPFSADDFERAGVGLATAAAADVDAAIELPAEVRPNADRLSHLAAPFPGIVRAVNKSIGDSVAAGETLAVIESENLVRYPLKAAFAGTVVDKHVTPGEVVTRENHLFIVADLSTVWIEIDVYLEALSSVREGQAVHVSAAGGKAEAQGEVAYISPIVDPVTRTATARVVLANEDGRWRPGSFATAALMNPRRVPVTVRRRALHTVEGKPVVFVVAGDRFEARPVTVGTQGRTLAEIRGGLAAGERYADGNSFLVKADLLKGEAEHAH
jgi:cobalt-zinc-cadmium efflux system membrane fusion protein